jgi:hypothetical protein
MYLRAAARASSTSPAGKFLHLLVSICRIMGLGVATFGVRVRKC